MTRPLRAARIGAVAAALVISLAGCTISSDTGGSGGGTDGATSTLTFWQYYTGTGRTWLAKQVADFEKKNPKVKIKLVDVVGDQQDQKLLASVATGTTPDLFINNIVVDYPSLQAAGVFKDLTSEWNAYADKSQFPSSAVWKTDGKVYNLMSYTNLIGLYSNTSILKQYGITTAPTTLDELQADLAKVKAGGKYKGIALSGAPTVEGAWLFAPQLLGQGIDYCNFSGPKVAAAFDRVENWAKAGYTPQATATWDQNAAWQQFATGKYAFGINGNWQLGNVKTAGFGYSTSQFPAPADGTSVVYPGGEGFGIGAKSKHADIAWKFLRDEIFTKSAGASLFTASGSIPVRADVASTPTIANNSYVQPFVKAAATTGRWPTNSNTANVQTALGKAVSSVLSGQSTGAQGAAAAEKNVAAALKAGGGACK